MRTKRIIIVTLILILSFLFTNVDTGYASSIANKTEVEDTIKANIKNHKLDFKVTVALNGNLSTLKEDLKELIDGYEKQYDDIIYLVNQYWYSYSCNPYGNSCDVNFKIRYHADPAEYMEYKNHVNNIVSGKQNLPFLEKVKFVNNYLADQAAYDYNGEGTRSPHTPVKIYKENLGVCQAYAIFAYDLLKGLGIDNYLLSGDANGGLHLWNVLKDENGNVVHLDTTWNDAPNRMTYFMVSSAELSVSHTFSTTDLMDISSLLNGSSIPQPDSSTHPMYSYAKEFFKNINNTVYLGDLGTLPVDKAFEIKFNDDVDDSHDYRTKVFITDTEGNIVDINTKVDGPFIRVYNTKSKFEPKDEYYLVILQGVESKRKIGKHLQKTTYIKFSIK